MFTQTSRDFPGRRRACWGDRLTIGVGCALLLETVVHLPRVWPEWPEVGQVSPVFRGLLPLHPALSGLVEMALLVALLLSYLLALSGLDSPRLRLTRPLAGAAMAVTLWVSISILLLSWGVVPGMIPVAVASLWVGRSFGSGAAIVTLFASLGALGALGGGEFLNLPTVVRGIILVFAARNARSIVRVGLAGLGAGTIAAALVAGSLLVSGPMDQGPMQPVWAQLVAGVIEFATFWATFGIGDRTLGHVSRDRLVALLDLCQPLLTRMIERAPGSFEHSRAMANLAEQAASAIGADALLTRVGAYYHDLGKSVEPKFFIENLLENETSPHTDLTPEQSVRHIVRHVTQGVRILRDAKIPEAIVEFSYTHHGKQSVEYFLNKQRKLHPDREVDEALFRYPGMLPSTKETAILMLVDSIEAASRTIDGRDRERIVEMVWRIIFSKLASGQLDESGLSMNELKIVAARVVDTLVFMNHHRIKYPWQEDPARRHLGERSLVPLSRPAKSA